MASLFHQLRLKSFAN